MRIFSKLFGKKKTAEELYWENNPNELANIQNMGEIYFQKLNAMSQEINNCFSVQNLIELKDLCMRVLDWFQVLDDRKCPYHINGTAQAFRNGLLERYNVSLVESNKNNNVEHILARNSLSKETINYDLCLNELSKQAQNGAFYGTPARWIRIAKRLFYENKALSFLEVYVECGLPRDIAFSGDSNKIMQSLPMKKGSQEYEMYATYSFALDNRYNLLKLPLIDITERYNLRLMADERILHRINNTILHEEKVVRRNISYSGLRWSSGLLRAGTISLIGSEIKDFVAQDIGRLYITNKRIIFVGNQRNVTIAINLNNVLFYNLYQDGVLVNQVNKKAILFKFDQTVDYGIYTIEDGLNEFTIVLNRLFEHTENDNLENQ